MRNPPVHSRPPESEDPVRFLMVVWADRDRALAWEDMPPAEQDREAQPLHAWYETHAAAGRIETGIELAWPRDRMSASSTADGPVIEYAAAEGASVLSGVVTLDVESLDVARELLRTWPDLRAPGDRVDLIPIRSYELA